MITKLSVNINKIATIRNARGGDTPSVIEAAKNCELFGADGITVHPRPDERHITTQDTYDLAKIVTTEFNIEGYPDDRFMELLRRCKPAQATLVPDPPNVLTSNAGWDTRKHHDFLKKTLSEIRAMGIRTSLFIGTDLDLIEGAALVKTDRIEFYTGPYAENFEENKIKAIEPYILAAQKAIDLGLAINAGHDLNLRNLKFFKQSLPALAEVSIGHALISDALYLGLENTINMYKRELNS